MKTILFSVLIASASVSQAATLVLKDGKVPESASTVITVILQVKSSVDFKSAGNGTFDATSQTQEMSGTAQIRQAGQTAAQSIDPKSTTTENPGTVMTLGKDSIQLKDSSGKTVKMRATFIRKNGALTIKVSDQDSLASAQRDLGEKIKEVSANPAIVQLSLTTTGLICQGTNGKLKCDLKATVKGTMAQ